MSEDQLQRLLWMLEALRLEVRASALIQQRSESAIAALLRDCSDRAARAAGSFGGQ